MARRRVDEERLSILTYPEASGLIPTSPFLDFCFWNINYGHIKQIFNKIIEKGLSSNLV